MEKTCSGKEDHPLSRVITLRERVYDPFPEPLGRLSNNDYTGHKNVTEKVNSRCFKLYRAYSISFNASNVGEFSGLEF